MLVTRLAPAWGVSDGALPQLVGLGEIATQGGRIARIEQVIDGLPVDHGELRVMVGTGGTLVATSGSLVAANSPRTRVAFADNDAGAIARAVAHTHHVAFDRGAALAAKYTKTGGGRVIGGVVSGIDVELAHAKQAWYPIDGTLLASWVVEAYTSKHDSTQSELYRTVISADGLRVLEHRSLQSDVAFKYRVFAETTGDFRPKDSPLEDVSPHPTGVPNGMFPNYTAPSLIEVEGTNHNPDGAADPWLASSRVETIGNNVEAYADLNAPSGFSNGDFRATSTAARTFDRTYDTALSPKSSQAQQMAAITSVFYGLNWLHDFWYDAGFTETAGNGQESNYDRGGQDRDAILAEAQDFSGTNNANMNTPSDGLPPRMQVYLWSGAETTNVTVGSLTPAVGTAAFGPESFNVTGAIVLANDGVAPLNSDACEPLSATVAGKIVLADRGNCSFKKKAQTIQAAGGVGMLLANNVAGTTPPGLGDDAAITQTITIPSLGITLADGDALKTQLGAGAVNATLQRTVGVQLEGSLDSTLLAHEFGHYVHHRLSQCGSTLCGAMSEGWGDFLALMLLARDGDNLEGAYPFSVYTTQSFSDDPAYFGIRRAPYSTNTSINALSFRHMADGEPLPSNHPFLVFGNNAEVHNAGEIWAATLWEAYVALQKAGTSFEDTRRKMAKYVVAGLLLTPVDATPTEVRDSILTAIFAASPADHAVVAAAFAKRGMGSCAVSPLADSTTFSGIVESMEVKGRAVVGAEVTEAGTACDEDAILDPGETLKIKVPIANRGHKALSNVTATLTSTTPGVTVVSPPMVMATIAPYGTADVVAEVKLDGALDVPTAGDFDLVISAQDGCDPSSSTKISIRMNVDDKPDASATDAFDTDASVWTASTSDTPVWTHVRDSANVLDGQWHGDDHGVTTDVSVVSPTVTVSDQPFSVTFVHRFDFELGDAGEAFDGGVVEYSIDAGATWKDVSDIATPGYTATLDPGNALGARMAFAGKNAAHPLTDMVTLDFGTQLAGKQVQLRFRIGTDGGVGAPGWDVDDVAFAGITGTPFATTVADEGVCDAGPEMPDGDDDDGGCCDAGPIGAGNIGAAFGVLALLLRRRRRRS